MTNIDLVMAKLLELGPSTSGELHKRLPDLTPRQVRQALCNAKGRKLCQLEGAVRGTIGGIWTACAVDDEDEAESDPDAPRGRYGIGKVASVWELGRRAA